MKKTIGQRCKEFREHPDRRWSPADMAIRVGTSRQNIENLEKGDVGQPKYIAGLAKVMGVSVDDLLGLKSPPVTEITRARAKRLPVSELILHLGEALAPLDELERGPIGELLKKLANNPGDARRISGMVSGLLANSGKKAA